MDLDLNDLVGDGAEPKKPAKTTEGATAVAEPETAVAAETPATEAAAETTAPAEAASEPATSEPATEAVAEETSAPAEVAETTSEPVAAEAPAIGEAEVISEEAAPATTTAASTQPAIKTVDLFQFLTDNKEKIENATTVAAKFPTIPEGKYALFITNEEEDASMYKVDSPNKLHFEEVTPEKIIVENSGIIIFAENRRIYAGKTNVVQFDCVDGSPVKMSTFKKANPGVAPKVDVKERVDAEMGVDEIKLHIKKVSPRLDAAVKELTTKEELKAAAVSFLGEIRDLNHLIKINDQVMMTCNL
jgi:hypothetical protein